MSCARCLLGRASLPSRCPFHEVRRPAGFVLQRQGEVPSSLSYLRSGIVVLSSVDVAGIETSCAVRGPGTLVGLEAARERRATLEVRTLTPVLFCRIDLGRFEAWSGGGPSRASATIALALDELARLHGERAALTGSATERVARYLLALAAAPLGRPPPTDRRLLARILAMRPETVSRALASLRRAGALGARGLRVADPAALARAAGAPRDAADPVEPEREGDSRRRRRGASAAR
jgi:CRP-like cAMP-binding protein